MTRKGAKIGRPDGFTEAVGKWPKSNCLTIIKRRQELTSRSSYLDATAPLDRPVSERNLEVSEFGLRDAWRVAPSPIMVWDPFLRG